MCETYTFYTAKFPHYLNLANIRDLFSVTSSNITKANDLPLETIELDEGQYLLIPITCRCMEAYSQANTIYQIKKGDTFYKVST